MKFLLIRYSSFGDVLLTTSVAKNIKRASMEHTVHILTKEEYRPVFLNNPDIDEVITGVNLKNKYDVILDLHNSIRSNIVKHLISAKTVLTYNKAAYVRRLYLNTRYRNIILDKNVIERYLEPLKQIGLSTEYVKPQFVVDSDELEKASEIIKGDYITISPGAKWKTKMWSLEYYTNFAVRIIRELDLKILLVGSSDDLEFIEKIYKGTGTLKNHIVNLAGKTSIRQLAAFLKNSRVLVSTDSGPMHLGWAVGTKVVAIFGPTVREFGFQPEDENVSIIEKDMDCRPCSLHGSRKCRYSDQACMQRIEVYEVFNEVKRFFS